MRLHLPAIPHTVTRGDFSHCAFTGKVQRFSPMLRRYGFEVVHYGVEGSVSGADIDIELMSTEEHLAALGVETYHTASTGFVGENARVDAPVYYQFNYALRQALKEQLEAGDILCLPFGVAHDSAWKGLPLVDTGKVTVIETGIGYPEPFALHRVYESEAWRHWMMGKESRGGCDWNTPRREWVIPNYYTVDDWPLGPGHGNRIVYFGRITEVKGCAIIPLLARERPDLEFVLCGQGDPAPYLTQPNVHYLPPVHGEERAVLLGHARATLHPSRFAEPFCGAAVEAMLCGTPVITSNFGAFTETVIDGVTGRRCEFDLRQWVKALDDVASFDRAEIRRRTVARYSTLTVGAMYAEAFTQVVNERE